MEAAASHALDLRASIEGALEHEQMPASPGRLKDLREMIGAFELFVADQVPSGDDGSFDAVLAATVAYRMYEWGEEDGRPDDHRLGVLGIRVRVAGRATADGVTLSSVELLGATSGKPLLPPGRNLEPDAIAAFVARGLPVGMG